MSRHCYTGKNAATSIPLYHTKLFTLGCSCSLQMTTVLLVYCNACVQWLADCMLCQPASGPVPVLCHVMREPTRAHTTSWQSLQWWTVPSISRWSGLQIGDRFKTLSLTLEMPFKDTIENPNPVQGWSPDRTKSFGASILNPIVDTVPSLDG